MTTTRTPYPLVVRLGHAAVVTVVALGLALGLVAAGPSAGSGPAPALRESTPCPPAGSLPGTPDAAESWLERCRGDAVGPAAPVRLDVDPCGNLTGLPRTPDAAEAWVAHCRARAAGGR